MTDASLTITAEDLRGALEAREEVTILDVRPAVERAEWSIPGSIHFDAYDALKAGDPFALSGLDLPTDRPVVTVCGAGKVSLIATERLRARGYDARSLAGGMKAWSLAWNSAEFSSPGNAARIVQVRRTGKGCLSYMIGAAGEAAVIDAAVDPTVYQDLAAQHGWRITHVLDTHIHADHLSRSRQLAEETGATLHVPETDRVAFPFAPVHDGDVIQIGAFRLRALRTPGHTLESTSYLLDEKVLFTGDTLFLTGVGRPDLDADPTQAQTRARLLHGSLRLLRLLAQDTVVLPAHTSRPVGFDAIPIAASLGEVIESTPLLTIPEDAFVKAILARIPPTPPNHAAIIALNEAGAMPAGDPTDLEAGANRCAVS